MIEGVSSVTILAVKKTEPRYIGEFMVCRLFSTKTDKTFAASAQGALTQLRSLGGAIGLAGATIIFNHRITSSSALSTILTPTEESALYKSPLVVSSFSPQQRAFVSLIYANAFTEEMQIATYISAACFTASLLTLERRVSQPAQRLPG